MVENCRIPERKLVNPVVSDKDVEFQGGFLLHPLGAVSRVLDLDAQTVHRRQVRVGRLLPEGLQVLDGLDGGEHVVVRGVHRLEEGRKVRLMNASVPPDSRSSSPQKSPK